MARQPFQNFLVRFGAGEDIFAEGDVGVTMYIVQAGKVELFRESDGQQRVLGEMQKGDFFGEMSILEGLPRASAARAVEPTELIEINSMTFDRMIKGNIEIAVRLLRKLSIRLRAAQQRIEVLETSDGEVAAPSRTNGKSKTPDVATDRSGLRLESTEEGAAFALNIPDTLIGRFDPVTELRPDVDLTDLDLKRSVSRQHARIVQTAEGFEVIEEVGALNGTFVNGEKLSTGQPHPIADGDELGFGMVKLVFKT